jgi:uncharacterized protein (TIGR02246 family)
LPGLVLRIRRRRPEPVSLLPWKGTGITITVKAGRPRAGEGTMTAEQIGKENENEIRRLIEGWLKAVRAMDIDGVMSFYAPDIVSFDVIPPLRYVGADAYRKDWEQGFAMSQGQGQFEIHELSIAACDDVAYSHNLTRMSGTMKDGQKYDSWMRWTMCFRRMEGRWMITHEHISAPVDMETGKALFDLKP